MRPIRRPGYFAPIATLDESPEGGRPPLPAREKALVALTLLHLAFLPWALGTMHAWSQLTSLGLATAGFILAGWSQPADSRAVGLLRRPVTWAAWWLLAYIALQALNPAWRYFSDETSWWLEPVEAVAWLPAGVDAPFALSNAWRAFTVFGSLALLTGSVWIGFRRRKSFQVLFTGLTVNAGLIALFGLAQQLSGTKEMFWCYAPSNLGFAASFIYPNHAGAYFYLMVAVAGGLAGWHVRRAQARGETSGTAALFVFLAVCCGLTVILSTSRMSLVLLLVLVLLFCGRIAWRLCQRSGPLPYRPELWQLIVIATVSLGLGVAAFASDKTHARFAELLSDPVAAGRDRTLARQAATTMLQEHWLYGWGAGCFRYGFSKYTRPYPEIHSSPEGAQKWWEHAHNDLLEIPIELGLVGTLPLAFVLGCTGWSLWRRRFWRNPLALTLVPGCALVALHAWVDFVFQNPAILLTWGVLLAGALRWTELDQPGGRPKATGSPPAEPAS